MKCNVREFERKTGRLEEAVKFMVEQSLDKKVAIMSDEISRCDVENILSKYPNAKRKNMTYYYLSDNDFKLMDSCDVLVAHVLKCNLGKLDNINCDLEIFTTK